MKIFARLGPRAALGADRLQWLLCVAQGKAEPPDLAAEWWRPVSYVRSTKAILVRCIREKGIEVSAEGRAILDALPDSFDAWKANPGLEGSPVPDEALKPPRRAENEFPAWSQRPGATRVAMIERLGPDCAIGTDGLQWIVYRRRPGGGGIEWQGEEWRADGYIHSSKRALIDCIKAKNLELSAEGQAALERQDPRIYRWRRSISTQVEAAPASARHH